MTASEERMEVLRMVQDGQITAEEAALLLEAMGKGESTPAQTVSDNSKREPRRLRVRVSDLETGRHKVNVNLPWNLINVGMHMGARFVPEGIDLETMRQAIRAGTEGKIVDVEDEEENERVEIFVE